KILNFCKENNVSKLVINPGEYIISTENAVKLEHDIFNGGFPNVPEELYTPGFKYDIGILISEFSDFTIDAAGVTFVCRGWMEPLSIRNCRNITINGLSIDYERKPNSVGKVVNVTNSFFDVEFYDYNEVSASACFPRITFWDSETRIIYKNDFYTKGKENLGNNSIRFFGSVSREILGLDAVAVHSLHFRPAILVNETENILFDSVSIHAQPGMGLVGNHSGNISLKNFRVVPVEGGYQSSNTDATHFTACYGEISFDNCQFQGQGDDATNIHGFYHSILNGGGSNQCDISVIWNQNDLSSVMNTHASLLDYPDVGDTFALVKRSTLQTVDFFQVVSNIQKPLEWKNSVTLDKNLPRDIRNFFLINITKMPSVKIMNTTVKSSLARGFLIKTSNVLIENCLVENITGTAVQISAEGDWLEGTTGSNITVRNCRFINCGRGSGTQMNACGISVNTKAPYRFKRGLYKNLRFENNVIEGGGAKYGIYLTCAEDVFLLNNKISGCRVPTYIFASRNIINKN
ncbi:MAG: right-handed parallel beta-helix repeat-containing protein, partial [Spirochaetales bacterium]|nr:right-handed parallel beta-helix repeat-containing protein [Spirochaetales bacterium]